MSPRLSLRGISSIGGFETLFTCSLSLRPSHQPTPAVRAAAFTLFGSLSRFGNGPSEGPFLEQIQTNFVSLLLHLDEGDPVVIAVSFIALHASSEAHFHVPDNICPTWVAFHPREEMNCS